ncbi:MAG: 50S ribosomal protein L6 [Minisyncoccales bacterium]
MRLDELNTEVEIPQGVTVTQDNKHLTVKGPKGEVTKEFRSPKIMISVDGNLIKLKSKKPTKREKTIAHTYRAHIRNMVKGVTEPFKYILKICSTHFPMNVSISGNKLIVKNFYGEKFPRELTIKNPDVKVNVNGDQVEVICSDIEAAGNVASDIEQLTRVTKKDLRIFQDGIYIIKKAGKD